MCGRYVSPEAAAIERQWQVARRYTADFAAHFNVAPSSQVPLLWMEDGALALGTARWGLVPHWWTRSVPPRLSHNARMEEAAVKPMWRDALRGARCIVPARGWYEWRPHDRQPFYFFRRDGRLAAFAGLMARHDGVLTCAILTTQADAGAAEVHERMPLALRGGADEEWLATGAHPLAGGEIAHYPVRRLVNSARADGPGLIEPVEA